MATSSRSFVSTPRRVGGNTTSTSSNNNTTFPSLTRGSSSNSSSQPVAPIWGPSLSTSTTTTSNSNSLESNLPSYKKKLSLASITNSFEALATDEATTAIHPLFDTWNVWFSHRSASNSGGKNNKREEAVGTGGKESREEWEGGVVKLGGFSSIESLHPFLAYLTPPSELPASITSASVISDINVFRSPISPLWEHPANTGGGRIFLRLKKGVADRIWEEVIFALVGERITSGEGGDEGENSTASKVNGAVLSVRKDEDILSLWTCACTRNEREAIRESLRAALEPLLTPTSLSSLSLDYKPHPVASHLNSNTPSTPHNNHHSIRESGNHGSGGHHNSNRRGGGGGGGGTERGDRGGEREDRETRDERRSHHHPNGERSERREGGSTRGGGGGGGDHSGTPDTRERPSRTGGFSSYRSSADPNSTSEPKSDYRNSTDRVGGGGGERTESYTRSSGGGYMTSNTNLKESRGSSSASSWGRS